MQPYVFVETTLSELGHPDALEQMLTGAIDGLWIKGLLDPVHCAQIVARLVARDPYLKRASRRPDEQPPYTVPRTLLAANDPELTDYLEEARAFVAALPQLIGPDRDLVAELARLFSSLAVGLPVAVPRTENGAAYAPFSVRTLAPGDHLAVHSGADLLSRPAQASGLRGFVVPDQQLSFFITLQPPEGGGELALYPIRWEQTDGAERVHGFPMALVAPSLETWSIRPGPGDMILFNGGRIYHSVTPVEGATDRITLGGFLAFDRSGARVYQWS